KKKAVRGPWDSWRCLFASRRTQRVSARRCGKAEVSRLRDGPCGAPERAGIAPRRTFRLGTATCTAIPSRARGTAISARSFGRAEIEPRSARTVPEPRNLRLATSVPGRGLCRAALGTNETCYIRGPWRFGKEFTGETVFQ